MDKFKLILIALMLPGCQWDQVTSESNLSSQAIFNCTLTYDQPGIYKLTDNLYSNDSCGIEITSDSVTIDLQGYTIHGPNDLNKVNYGIVGINRNNVNIYGGTITGFGFGIALTSTTGTGYGVNPFSIPVILRLDIFQMVSRSRKKFQELAVYTSKNCAAVSCCNAFSIFQA